MTTVLNKYSRRITQPKSQGASQAMLYGTGMTEEDMDKPQVGIASVWYEGNTCNMHLLDLAAKVKEGVTGGRLVGMRFNTIGVSDGISMGTEGMSYSLQSRDLIADSIETVMGGQWYDALDRAARLRQEHARLPDRHGAAESPGDHGLRRHDQAGCTPFRDDEHQQEETPDIVSAFQCYGEYLAGTITEEQRKAIVKVSCPGAGACGGMYTANTMASAIEAMGMSLPYSASIPAEDPDKLEECVQAGAAIRTLLERDIKPRDIMTREAFENAMVVVMALGGSTNAVLHLIAMARSRRRAADDRRFPTGQRPRAVPGRPEAERQVRAGRLAQRRRHAGRDEVPAGRRFPERRLPDRDRQDAGREPGTAAGPEGRPNDRAPARQSDQADGPHSDSARQPRARRRGRQDHRQGRTAVPRPGQRVRLRGRDAGRAGTEARSTRATWSSFATKVPKADPACPRC